MFDAVTYVLAKNASKKYTDYIATSLEWKTQIVEEVPDPAEADSHTIYFVPTDPEDPSAGYDEYIKVNDSTMERMGSTAIVPDLHAVGFLTDANDDEMLIIDCDTIYSNVDSYNKYKEYIEQFYNITEVESEYRGGLTGSYSWMSTRSSADQLKCWCFFANIHRTDENTDMPTLSIIYSTGIPYLDENNVLKCKLNNTDVAFGNSWQIWSRYRNSNYGNPWTDPSSSMTYMSFDPPSYGYYTKTAFIQFPNLKVKKD